jgi:hypothetical protein
MRLRSCVRWAKRSVPTIKHTDVENGGHASLCPPYEAVNLFMAGRKAAVILCDG